MEPPMFVIGPNKPVMLDTKPYGYWKVRMMQHIRGQGEDAWTAIEDGWETPFDVVEDGQKILKPKSLRTVE